MINIYIPSDSPCIKYAISLSNAFLLIFKINCFKPFTIGVDSIIDASNMYQ